MKRISPRILIATIGLMSVFLGLAVRAATRTDKTVSDGDIEILSPSQMDYDPFADNSPAKPSELEPLPAVEAGGEENQLDERSKPIESFPPINESDRSTQPSDPQAKEISALQDPQRFMQPDARSTSGVVRLPTVSDETSIAETNEDSQKPPLPLANHPYLADPTDLATQEIERFPTIDGSAIEEDSSNRRGFSDEREMDTAVVPARPLEMPTSNEREPELLPPIEPQRLAHNENAQIASLERFPNVGQTTEPPSQSPIVENEIASRTLDADASELAPVSNEESASLADAATPETEISRNSLSLEQLTANHRANLNLSPLSPLPSDPTPFGNSSRRVPNQPVQPALESSTSEVAVAEIAIPEIPNRPLPVIQARLDSSDLESPSNPSLIRTTGFGGDDDPYSLANLDVRAQPIPSVEPRPSSVSRNSNERTSIEVDRVEIASLPMGIQTTTPQRMSASVPTQAEPTSDSALQTVAPASRTLSPRASDLATARLQTGSARIPEAQVPNQMSEAPSLQSSNRRSLVVQRAAPYVREFPRAQGEQIAQAGNHVDTQASERAPNPQVRAEPQNRNELETLAVENTPPADTSPNIDAVAPAQGPAETSNRNQGVASNRAQNQTQQSSEPTSRVAEAPIQGSSLDEFELPKIPEFAIQNSSPSSRRSEEGVSPEGRQVNWQGQDHPSTANSIENAQLNESPSDRRVRSPLAELTQQNLPAEYRESPPISIQEGAVPTQEGSDPFDQYGNEFIEEPFSDDLLADPFSQSANCRAGCVPKYYVMADLIAYRPDLGRLSISNVIDTDQAFFREGARVTFGYKSDCTYGWEASFLHLTHAADISSSTNSGVTGPLSTRFIPTAGFTNADLSSFNSPAAQVHVQDHRYQFTNFELHRTTWGWDVVNTQWGLRVMHMQEDVSLGSSPVGQAFELMPGRFQQSISNLLVGPQFGMTLIDDSRRAITFDLSGKLGAYANLLDLDTLYANNNQVLLNRRGVDEVKFAVSGEMSTGISWNLTPNLKLRGGLDLLWVYGVGTLNAQQLGAPAPNQGGILLSGGTGALLRNDDDLFLWGGTIGLYGNWP